MSNMATALLLEDEPLIAMSVEDELETAGFVVSTVVSCEEANAWLDAATPDVVIVDIQLRDGPACRVVSRLIEAKIPFIVHSGDHPHMHEGSPYVEGLWVSKPQAGDEIADAARALLIAA